jgi:phage-related minor tail protein
VSDSDIVQRARAEASAIVAEAEDQARMLLEAAERRRHEADIGTDALRAEGAELARNLERSIQLLTQILEELRRQLQ